MEIPNRSELAFLPGQYVNITVPGTDQTRSYSFSNAPHDDRLTFLVKLTPGGAMSEYLAQRASVGDTISFTGPNGSLLPARDRPSGAAAGRRHGTGAGPVDTAHHAGRPQPAQGSPDLRREHRRGPGGSSIRSKRSHLLCPDSPGTTASPTRSPQPSTRAT